MKKVKGPDDEFWARANAEGKREIERRVIGDAAWDDEEMQRELAEKFGGKDGDCPGCGKCEGATLKG